MKNSGSGLRILLCVPLAIIAAICLYLTFYAFSTAQVAGGFRALVAVLVCLVLIGLLFPMDEKKNLLFWLLSREKKEKEPEQEASEPAKQYAPQYAPAAPSGSWGWSTPAQAKSDEPQVITPSQPSTATSETSNSTDKPRVISVSPVVDGKPVAYNYDRVIVTLIPDLNPEALLGHYATFANGANGSVEVLIEGYAVGTIKSSKIAEIVSDWLLRHDPIIAIITEYGNEEYYVAFNLYLYRAETTRKMKHNPEAREFRLTGNSNEDMQYNISLCRIGESCYISYDYDKEKYCVSSELDIGYLPKAAEDFIDENRGVEAVSAIISDIGENDSGKQYVKIYIAPVHWE